jgi:flavin reductase (DIM6/NTAB) family NADH-FMN oxidoreductase RutF
MMTIDPAKEKTAKIHSILLGSVAPRPIAFASTIDKYGNPNLSPFSFFNAFGSNPPVLIFSPSRRVRDNTTKHTLENLQETNEVVINMVNYNMVQQASLASTEYPRGVNEFEKAGFTMEPSLVVTPPRVKESPVQYECKVLQIIETGTEGGAGNLVICEVVMIHVSEDVLDAEGRIDQHKIDLVARMGGNWYCRASGKAIFEVEKPLSRMGIGVDGIPERIRYSKVLSGNDLGMLGNIESIPSSEEVDKISDAEVVQNILSSLNPREEKRMELHKLAKSHLEKAEVADAWKILLLSENL